MRRLLVFIFVLFGLILSIRGEKQAPAPITPREEINFDFDWRFHLGDVPEASAPTFDDSSWRKLDVPHDWSIEGKYEKENPGVGVSGYLPTGIGWYRKTFNVTPAMLYGDVTIFFDAAFMDSTTWINGVQLGEEPFGFMSFYYDMTKYLHPGMNTVAVRVNNSVQPAERWYTGSGIYGHVKLITTQKTHIAMWSTFIRTKSISNNAGLIDISTAIDKADGDVKPSAIRFTVMDGPHDVASQTISLKHAPVPDLAHPTEISVPNAHLWSPDTPSLYILRTELLADKTVVDREDTTFGIRTTAFDPDKGFLINGHVLKLRGLSDRIYGGPMGAAIPDEILERRMQMLKDMGVNAIRAVTGPHTPYFYELCDRMGFLVMDEVYDGWGTKVKNEYSDRYYKTQWHHDVEDWIRRDRNYPSIFVWSIGNETGGGPPVGSDVNHMTEYVHSFDPSRPTTGGTILFGVDVSGFNGPGEVPGVLEKFHAEHPAQPIILTEEPHTLQTRGFYRVRTWWRDWKPVWDFKPYGTEEIFFDGNPWYNSSYDNAVVRNNSRESWKRTSTIPWISGEFRWLGFDYLGEAEYKGGHWPDRAENFGIIDLAGIPKDDYYLYQAFWTTTPMVHLLPHWTHPGMKGVVIPVVAYSNQPEVELFLDGVSLGRHKPEVIDDFLWKVPYQPGKLEAIAYDAAGQKVASTSFTTAGDPDSIKIETDNANLRPNRTDDAIVTFTVMDKNGIMVPWDMDRINFKVNGPVHLLGNENGDPADVTPNQAPYRRAFYGMARGFYQSTEVDGPIDITAAAILGDKHIASASSQHPRMVAIAVSQTALRGALPKNTIEIHYTLDGTEPTVSSPPYTVPFGIWNDTFVRALVLKDGKPEMTLSQHFHRTDDPVVSDPRWATTSQHDPLGR